MWRHLYPSDFLDRIRDKWMGLVDPARRPGFYVGNQHQEPQGFLILGIARDIDPTVTPVTIQSTTDGTAQSSSPSRHHRQLRLLGDSPAGDAQL